MAPKEINILIQGEMGTGKEIFAQGIQNLSARKDGKFVAVNCAAFMSLAMQAKLLRVLQEKTLRWLGSTKSIPVDVRIIAFCNEDAYTLSENGRLRRDLFYRLASVVIEIPPLRERVEDIVQLTWHYIHKNQELTTPSITEIPPAFGIGCSSTAGRAMCGSCFIY